MTRAEVEVRSRVEAPAADVWKRVTSPEGINHELSREFLWRGLPTDLAATFADPTKPVRIAGRVTNGGQPVANVQVSALVGDTGSRCERPVSIERASSTT